MTEIAQYNNSFLKHKRSFDQTFNNNSSFNNSSNSILSKSFNNQLFNDNSNKPFEFKPFDNSFSSAFCDQLNFNKKSKHLNQTLSDKILMDQTLSDKMLLKFDNIFKEFEKINEKINLIVTNIESINKKIDNIEQTLKNIYGETEITFERTFSKECSYIS
jgi:uncharacterized protein YbbC (DUF1343 family)